MNKEESIIKFYMVANKLKDKLRTGWLEIGIDRKRTESVAEHIYGTLILAIALDSEYELDLDMFKVLKTLILHETEEMLMPDFTIRSGVSEEEKIKLGKISVKQATEGLIKQEEIEKLLNEFNERKTKEAVFCYLVDKMECDFQAKLYDLEGTMSIEQAKEDLTYYGDRSEEIEKASVSASDYWLEGDRIKYKDNKMFEDLLNAIKNISN